MSYTKKTINSLIENCNKIQNETIEDNDLTKLLDALNTIMEIGELFSNKDNELIFYWNEIISEFISVLYSSLSGYYRLSLSGLRSILELSCRAFFYYDHKIELQLSINENLKADKYVSTLVNEYFFFTTKYINTFNTDINKYEKINDSVSNFLKNEYSTLSNIVHGRNNTLFKKSDLKIEYNKGNYKNFEKHFFNVSSAVALMYIFRFQDYSKNNINKLATLSHIIKDIQ